MIKMRPYVPSNRIAIRDSNSIDEDVSDDVDDDVFIKDARSSKLSEEKGLKRPLMAPRRKNGRTHSSVPIMKKHRRCWRCWEPFCYGLASLTILIAIISLAALILTMFPVPMHRLKVWLKTETSSFANLKSSHTAPLKGQGGSYSDSLRTDFVPCTQISVQKIWTKTFPRMNSESPVRKVDLNGDNVKDILFGFGVDDNIQYEGYPLPKCQSPQQGDDVPCEGGVIAINGANGELLWQAWSVANVFSILCNLDINRDGYPDCVAAGRLGMIFAINGRNGHNIWEFREIEVETNSPIVMDLYTISVVRDLDGDEIQDILAAHLEEREESKAGHIKLISGRTGKAIRMIPTPFREEVFVPMQVITQQDGTELLLIITGGQNTPGGVYSIRLLSLMQYTSEKEFTPLFQSESSGLMSPALLTDITGDSISDVVVSTFNSTVYAFDGHDFRMLWNYTFPDSESVSSIVPGHFNNDNVTDFMVKYNTGPGFPVYYYSQTTILDGKTGRPLLDTMMTDSGGSSSLLAGVSISQTFGSDFFLHWQMQCRDKYEAKDAYEFIPDSDIIQQARADTCRLRYNASTVIKLYAIAQQIEPPGAVIFSTDDLEVHLNRTQVSQTIKKNSKSPLKHPKMLKKLLQNREQLLKKFAVNEVLQNAEKSLFDQASGFRKDLRNPLLDQDVLQEILTANNQAAAPPANANEQSKVSSYPYLGGSFNVNPQLHNVAKDYEAESAPHIPEEYDVLYNDNELPQLVVQNDRPIRLRTKYPGNRGVRSDITSFEDELINGTEVMVPTGGVPRNSLEKQEPYSLWDLEMEKEQRDAITESHKKDFSDSNDQEDVNAKRKRRSSQYLGSTTATPDQDGASSTTVPTDSDDWFLASISSTGVLLKSLNNTRSSVDFAFVLNIRESETYPPLFLPQDLNCVEEKISAYKSYTIDNLRVLRSQFLKQCLSDRLVTPNVPKYESQLVVVRIGITCTCRALQPGKVCSELNDIDTQRWTEYMGNDGNGYYAN